MSDANMNEGQPGVTPITGTDATASDADPAQAEWDDTTARDAGRAEDIDDGALQGPDQEIPFEDLPESVRQPESQGADPLVAELGEEGEGDLSPEDL